MMCESLWCGRAPMSSKGPEPAHPNIIRRVLAVYCDGIPEARTPGPPRRVPVALAIGLSKAKAAFVW